MPNKKEPVERVVLKLPSSIAKYFRESFPHGKRSEFVVEKILEHKHQLKVKKIEEELRAVNKERQ